MKRCLVLGAGGFIGKSLCRKLSKNYEIIAYDRAYVIELEELNNTRQVIGDFTKTRDFTDILQGVDVVIHLISTTLPTEDTAHIGEEIADNIIPTVALLEAMVKSNVKEIIFSSSGGTVYGETGEQINSVESPLHPICSYGVQKKVIETYLEFYGVRYGMNYKIARITNPYGIGQDINKHQGVIPIFIRRLLEDDDITIFGDGNEVRDYIYMEDLMNFLEKILEYKGDRHIFNVGTGGVSSLNQIIEKIEKTVGKEFKNKVYREKRTCDVNKSLLEVEDTWQALNCRPAVTLDEGIRRLYYRLKKDT